MNNAHTTRSFFQANTIVLAVVVVAALYLGRDVLLPFALSILLSFLLAPLVGLLERVLPRTAAVLLTVVASLLAVTVLTFLVAQQAYHFAYNLREYRENIVTKAQAFKPGEDSVFSRVTKAFDDVRRSLADVPPTKTPVAGSEAPAAEPDSDPQPNDDPRNGLDGTERKGPVLVELVERLSVQEVATNVLGPLVGPLGTAAMVSIFVIFMLLEREDLRNRMVHLVGAKQINATTRVFDDAAKRVSKYLLMQLVINASYGLAIFIGLFFIGLPNAFLWGVLTTILRFIPYVGPWLGAIMPLALSLAVFDGWTQPLLVLGLFIVCELISNNVLEPWLYGASTGISTVGILASAVFWSWLWGPVGLVIATPLTVCLTVIGRYVPQLRFLNMLISDDEVLPPEARYYQRLLAQDPEEALEVAETYLEANSLEALFDKVIVPALELAEHDRHRGDLEPVQQTFIEQTTREIIDDLATRNSVPASADDTATFPIAAASTAVLCVPARDAADELVGVMLVHLLQRRGVIAEVSSTRTLSGELLDKIETQAIPLVCISALPPYAATHARYLCKRLRPRFARLRIQVGLWMADTAPKSQERLRQAGADRIFTSLADAAETLAAQSSSGQRLATA